MTWLGKFIASLSPHPGPLPRGEGESFRFLSPSKLWVGEIIFRVNKCIAGHFLSPGERARVRASVTHSNGAPASGTARCVFRMNLTLYLEAGTPMIYA